jgi:hypothetical protein
LNIQPRHLTAMPVVTSVEALDRNFNPHPEGLFSTIIFGRVGDDRRLTSYAHIDLKVSLIYPLIWYHLMSMHAFYAEIAAGKTYANFDEKVGDFVKSDMLNGQTGYDYFATNWQKIKFVKTKSLTRNNAIDVINKYRGDGDMTSKLLVIPAGLRDIEIDEVTKRITKDELNDLYRKILAQSLSLSEIVIKTNPRTVNNARYGMQLTFNDIFLYFIKNMGGKNHMIQGQFMARNLDNGTRNVITALSTEPEHYGDEGVPGYRNMSVGIYQAIRACEPNAIHAMRSEFINHVFAGSTVPVPLINKKTLETEFVSVDPNYQERWKSIEGLTKIILLYEREELRTLPITIKDHYLCLTWRGVIDGKDAFKLVSNTATIPDWAKAVKHTLTPTTLIEFFYATTFHALHNTPAWSTRYPIGSAGSTYANELFVRTTEKSERRYALDEHWEIDKNKKIAWSFPSVDVTASIINASSPHSAALKPTNADFDGDKMATNAVQLPESKAAMRKLAQRWESVVHTDGKLMASCSVDTAEYVLFNMTGDYK